jgi:rubrerythrin
MGLNFNADEVFEIAERIERNGAAFYRRAAELVSSAEAKDMMRKLAEMEEIHETNFKDMRRELLDKEVADTTFDPEGLAGGYIQALADGRVFNHKADPMRHFTPGIKVQDILHIAIGLERDSIVFYLGLKGIVPTEQGKSKIDNIIREEMRHITILNQQLTSIEQFE